MRLLRAAALALAVSPAAYGEVAVELCFNYGCANRSVVRLEASRFDAIGAGLGGADDAASERVALAAAVGALYRMLGEQAPVGADRAGNYLDAGAHGRMDCIDHSTTTTGLLEALAARGWLRHHRVMAPVRRTRFVLQHFSAAIEQIEDGLARDTPPDPQTPSLSFAPCDCENGFLYVARAAGSSAAAASEQGRFVVDSWFVEHGEAAVVLPLSGWLKGDGPNVQ